MSNTDAFKLKILQEEYCNKNKFKPSYGVLYVKTFGQLEYINFSFDELNAAVDTFLKAYKLGRNYSETILNQTRVSDHKHSNAMPNIPNCITHVAFCDFLRPCILSVYNDPLLNRLKYILDFEVDILRKSWPSMEFTSKLLPNGKKDPSLFHIEPAPCYVNGECFLARYLANTPHADDLQLGLAKTALNGDQIIKNIGWNQWHNKTSCDPPVFLCYFSGQCNLFLYSEFVESLKKGYKSLYRSFPKIFNNSQKLQHFDQIERALEQPYANFTDVGLSIGKFCAPIYMYVDNTWSFYFYREAWPKKLWPVFADMRSDFKNLVIPDFLLDVKIEKPKCGVPHEMCPMVTVENEIINKAMSADIFSKLTDGKYITGLPVYVLSTYTFPLTFDELKLVTINKTMPCISKNLTVPIATTQQVMTTTGNYEKLMNSTNLNQFNDSLTSTVIPIQEDNNEKEETGNKGKIATAIALGLSSLVFLGGILSLNQQNSSNETATNFSAPTSIDGQR